MKKSVLIALLGLSSTQAISISQKEESTASQEHSATSEQKDNATNVSSPALVETGYELVETIANLESRQDDFDHQQEMDDADEDAEEVVREAQEDDVEEDALMGIEVNGPAAAAAAAAPALAAAAVAAPAAPVKTPKNKDSSDEECACAPGKESTKQKATIRAKQEKRIADAKSAKTAATAAKSSAEDAIAAANLAKRTGAKNILELAKAAEDAISKATEAENKSIEK
jgi:hypothetical protein